jgi:hypothetical protein
MTKIPDHLTEESFIIIDDVILVLVLAINKDRLSLIGQIVKCELVVRLEVDGSSFYIGNDKQRLMTCKHICWHVDLTQHQLESMENNFVEEDHELCRDEEKLNEEPEMEGNRG